MIIFGLRNIFYCYLNKQVYLKNGDILELNNSFLIWK